MSKLVGLDLGTDTIKVVELDTVNNSSRLVAAAAGPSTSKGLLSESQVDLDELSDTIRKVSSEAGITTREVNVALPESMVFTRVVDMPQMTEKELASAIQWEAEQYIPLPLSEVELRHVVLDTHMLKDNQTKMHVLLVAAPRKLIDKIQKVIQKTGLELVSLETESLSLLRAFLNPGQPTQSVTLFIDIGAKDTTVFVTKGESLAVTYVIPSGGLAFTRALAADLNIDQMQAEEYKKTYGLKQEIMAGKIGNAMKPLLDNLITELKRAVTYYQSQSGVSEQITKAVLIGGSAKMPGLSTYITESLGIQTEIGDPWTHVTDTQKLSSLSVDPIIFAEAIGLAMQTA